MFFEDKKILFNLSNVVLIKGYQKAFYAYFMRIYCGKKHIDNTMKRTCIDFLLLLY